MRNFVFSLALLTAFGPAYAQFGGSRHGGMGGGSRQGSGGDDLSGVTRMSANDKIRMQLTDARFALQLTPEQNPLFQAYQDRVIGLLSDVGRAAEAPQGEDALKQLDRRVDQARNRLAEMEEISGAAKRLYAALSPEQKTIADRVLPGTVPALPR
ncbi:MAG TPA: Spy/CpxP family protein refolding chaperone [Burkholderiales bacterium]|nr:Spy/CpxP family protein refolding chaperone [Burkholderiales bacterium]